MKKSLIGIITIFLLTACQPTVKVEAPDKPIVVDLNVKIEQRVKVQIDKDLEKTMQKNGDVF